MILVAGGTGLLGSKVVKLLVDSGERVRVLTRDPSRASHLPAGIDVVVGDVRREPLDNVVDGCEQVVSAVQGFVGPARTSPAAIDRGGNQNLISAAARVGVDRFVLVSVVGAAPNHPMSLHRMKYAAEQDLTASAVTGVIVRSVPFLQTWIDVIGGGITDGRPARVFGPGRNEINFVSADDVAVFVCLAVSGDPRIGTDVSVGGPENLSFLEIARHLLALRGRSEEPAHIPLGALKVMSAIARPFNPGFARRARAAVVMNTTDMTFNARPTRDRFPEIPATTLVEVTAGTASAGSGAPH